MIHRIEIKGSIVPNDYQWFYDYMEMECTCPENVQDVLNVCVPGDEIQVFINSPGGVIESGSEIYTMLREATDFCDVKIYITGEACSAASVIACAAYCEMSPTALMMVHCVSTCAEGNHNDMEKTAEILQTADRALCTAYTEKTGMTEDEALQMMEAETWLNAEQAKEKGLVDAIMFEEAEQSLLVAGPLFSLPTSNQMEKARVAMEESRAEKEKELAKCQLDFLQLDNKVNEENTHSPIGQEVKR